MGRGKKTGSEARARLWRAALSTVCAAAACGGNARSGLVKLAPAGGAGGAAGVLLAGDGGSAGNVTAGGEAGAAGVAGCDDTLIDGDCLARPFELVRIEGCEHMSLALHDGVIYFTDTAHGSVRSVSVTGEPVSDLATAQGAPDAIAVDDTGVYFTTTGTEQSDRTILRVPLGGGALQKITDVPPADPPSQVPPEYVRTTALVLDGHGSLYFGNETHLMKVGTQAGSTPTKLGIIDGPPPALVLSDNPAMAVMTTPWGGDWLKYLPLDGSTCVEKFVWPNTGACHFAKQIGPLPDTLSLAGTQLLFGSEDALKSASLTMPLGSGVSDATIADRSTDFDPVSGFVRDGSTVYFGELSSGIIAKGTADYFGLMPPDPVTLVQDPENEPSPGSFQIDARNVYWRTFDAAMKECTIMKLAR